MDKLEAISATIIKEALACKEPWSLENSVSICYGCNKNIESLQSKLRKYVMVRYTRKS